MRVELCNYCDKQQPRRSGSPNRVQLVSMLGAVFCIIRLCSGILLRGDARLKDNSGFTGVTATPRAELEATVPDLPVAYPLGLNRLM